MVVLAAGLTRRVGQDWDCQVVEGDEMFASGVATQVLRMCLMSSASDVRAWPSAAILASK